MRMRKGGGGDGLCECLLIPRVTRSFARLLLNCKAGFCNVRFLSFILTWISASSHSFWSSMACIGLTAAKWHLKICARFKGKEI